MTLHGVIALILRFSPIFYTFNWPHNINVPDDDDDDDVDRVTGVESVTWPSVVLDSCSLLLLAAALYSQTATVIAVDSYWHHNYKSTGDVRASWFVWSASWDLVSLCFISSHLNTPVNHHSHLLSLLPSLFLIRSTIITATDWWILWLLYQPRSCMVYLEFWPCDLDLWH